MYCELCAYSVKIAVFRMLVAVWELLVCTDQHLNSLRAGVLLGLQCVQWRDKAGSSLVLGALPSASACCLGGKLVYTGPVVSTAG